MYLGDLPFYLPVAQLSMFRELLSTTTSTESSILQALACSQQQDNSMLPTNLTVSSDKSSLEGAHFYKLPDFSSINGEHFCRDFIY